MILASIKVLYQQGKKNGAFIELIDEEELLQIEPLAKTYQKAIWSPETAAVDPKKVCERLKEKLREKGVRILFNQLVVSVDKGIKQVKVKDGTSYGYGFLHNCAGLYADKIARVFEVNQYQLMPFKGLYLKADTRFLKLKTNIYPVPNAALPFLGVHFTVTGDGITKLGPTALPAFWRENYQGLNGFSAKELIEIGRWYFSNLVNDNFGFRKLIKTESKYLFKTRLMSEAAKLIKGKLDKNAFKKSPPGIRAQLFDKTKRTLVSDFVFERRDNSIHVLNAVSPGFTSSFAVAKYIVSEGMK